MGKCWLKSESNPASLAWSVFAFGYAATLLADRLKRGEPDAPTIFLLAAILFVIVRPTTSWSAVVLAMAQLFIGLRGWTLSSYEHVYVGVCTSLGILAAYSAASVRAKSRTPPVSSVWDFARPYFLYISATGIFFAGFAKLNRDYFDPDFSVGAVLYQWMRENPLFFFLHGGRIGDWTGIIGGVGLELLAPILILFRKTRLIGLLVLWLLSLLLVLNPQVVLVDFIGLFFVLSLAGIPEKMWADLSLLLSKASFLLERCCQCPKKIFVLSAKVVAAFLVTIVTIISWRDPVDLGFPSQAHTRVLLLELTRYAFATFILISVSLLLVSVRTRKFNLDQGCWWSPGLLLLAAIFTVHQVTPYIGLHHSTTLTMASNARLRPADSNHFIFSSIPTFGWTHEVEIIESRNPKLSPGMRMPIVAMYDRARAHPRASFSYRLRDQDITVRNPEKELDIKSPSLLVWALRINPYYPRKDPASPTKPPPGMTPEQWKEHKKNILRDRAAPPRPAIENGKSPPMRP